MTDLSASIDLISVRQIADYFSVPDYIISEAINNKAQTFQDVHNYIKSREKKTIIKPVHISDNLYQARSAEEVKDLNAYHNASEKEAKYAAIRESCEKLMLAIYENCPECMDRFTAIQAVRQARMWANSAIALEK